MKVLCLTLVLTSLSVSSVLGQEEEEKNCDFECPTKGKILITILTPVLSPHCPLLTRWEFRRPLHLPAVLPVCGLQAREELLSLRPVLGRHQEVLHLQERGGVRPSGQHAPAPHHHAPPGHGGQVPGDGVQPALVLLLLRRHQDTGRPPAGGNTADGSRHDRRETSCQF